MLKLKEHPRGIMVVKTPQASGLSSLSTRSIQKFCSMAPLFEASFSSSPYSRRSERIQCFGTGAIPYHTTSYHYITLQHST